MKNLGSINVLGMPQKVVLCTPEEAGVDQMSDKDAGAHNAEDCTIYLNRAFNTVPARVRENIIHETGHAWFEASGLRNYLQGVCGLQGEAWAEVEENCIRMLSPSVSLTLPTLNEVISGISAKALK